MHFSTQEGVTGLYYTRL